MAPIRISRQRMTECPACHSHIQVSEQPAETICAFCGAGLLAAAAEKPAGALELVRRAGSGRSSALAASLLGLSLAACGGKSGGAGTDKNDVFGGDLGAADASDGSGGETSGDGAGGDGGVDGLADAGPDGLAPDSNDGENIDVTPTPDGAFDGGPFADVEDGGVAPLYGLPQDTDDEEPDVPGLPDLK